MAQPISNTLQNPFGSTSGLVKPVAKPATGFGTPTISGIFGPIGSAFNSFNQALPKLGHQTPAAPAGPFGTPSPALMASANAAQTAATQPKSTGTIGLAPTGSTTSAGSFNPNANYNAGVTPQQTPAGTPVPQLSNAGVSTAPTTSRGLFPDVVSSLAGSSAANAALGANAQKIAADAGQQIADVGGQGARFEAGQRTTGTSPVAEGNAAVTAQTTAAQQSAIAQGASQALQGNQQAISAQGQTQSALTSAGGLAQPQLGSIGQVPYSPTDLSQGSPLGAPGGSAADAARVAGQFQGAQAAAAAPGQAAASNTQTAGTAATNSYAGIYNTANTNAANYSQQQSAINSVGSQALSLLNSIPDRSSSQFVNARLNQLATQFSSPEYAAFNTAVQSLQARIGQALQAGEIPTAATGNAQSIANGNLTVGALAATLQQVDKEMSTFVQTQTDLANYAKSQIGNAPTANTTQTGGTTVSGFGWDGQ